MERVAPFAVTLCFVSSLLLSVGAQPASTAEPVVVEKGDTLWEVSQKLLENPKDWPKLWYYNQFITNPHLIYPGEVLSDTPPAPPAPLEAAAPGEGPRPTAQVTKPPEEPPLEMESPPVAPAPPPLVPRAPERVESPRPSPPREEASPAAAVKVVPVKAAAGPKPAFPGGLLPGFIRSGLQVPGPVITGSDARQTLLLKGDTVYLNIGSEAGVKPGDIFHAFTSQGKVMHPVTKAMIGQKMKVLGELQVLSVEADRSRATITDAPAPIRVGAMVSPGTRRVPPIFAKKPTTSVSGVVIGSLERVAEIVEHQVAFLDVGQKAGLELGHELEAVRIQPPPRGSVEGTAGQETVVGKMVVIDLQEATSTVVVTRNEAAIWIGDRVRGIGQ